MACRLSRPERPKSGPSRRRLAQASSINPGWELAEQEPAMSRLRRVRSPFIPLTSPPTWEWLVIGLEKQIKGALFKCSRCGNCILQETAFICPMLCPKGLRNGPCGSGASGRCCVEPTRPCVWHLIYQRAERLGRLDRLLEVQAPLDWSRVGHETWMSVCATARERGLLFPFRATRDSQWL